MRIENADRLDFGFAMSASWIRIVRHFPRESKRQRYVIYIFGTIDVSQSQIDSFIHTQQSQEDCTVDCTLKIKNFIRYGLRYCIRMFYLHVLDYIRVPYNVCPSDNNVTVLSTPITTKIQRTEKERDQTSKRRKQ